MRALSILLVIPFMLGCKDSKPSEPTKAATAETNVPKPAGDLVVLYKDGTQKTLALPGGELATSVTGEGVDLKWKGATVTGCDVNVARGNGSIEATHQGASVYVLCKDPDENAVTVIKLALGDPPSVVGQVSMDSSADLSKLESFDYKMDPTAVTPPSAEAAAKWLALVAANNYDAASYSSFPVAILTAGTTVCPVKSEPLDFKDTLACLHKNAVPAGHTKWDAVADVPADVVARAKSNNASVHRFRSKGTDATSTVDVLVADNGRVSGVSYDIKASK